MARPKLSITVDPDLLQAVDSFVQEHDGLDRSKVIEQALELWTAARQKADMEAQFSNDDEPVDERAAWRLTRRSAAAARLKRR